MAAARTVCFVSLLKPHVQGKARVAADDLRFGTPNDRMANSSLASMYE